MTKTLACWDTGTAHFLCRRGPSQGINCRSNGSKQMDLNGNKQVWRKVSFYCSVVCLIAEWALNPKESVWYRSRTVSCLFKCDGNEKKLSTDFDRAIMLSYTLHKFGTQVLDWVWINDLFSFSQLLDSKRLHEIDATANQQISIAETKWILRK